MSFLHAAAFTALSVDGVILVGFLIRRLRRKSAHESRKNDPVWLRGYIKRLEADLIERLDIERNLAFMASVSERDPNCVIEMARDGSLGYQNPATQKTFPDLKELGKKHPVLTGLDDALHLIQRDGRSSLRRPFRYADRVFEQEITWSAETQKLCLYMTDVTEWKRREQLQTELLHTVSHEFRTPLASILATAKMMENEILGPVTADQRQMLSIVGHSATRLNRMVSELLDLAKMEDGKFELHWANIHLSDLIENVALSFGPLAKERGIDLKSDVGNQPIFCLGDGDKIVQIFTNLTNNALKFTKTGQITLSAQMDSDNVRCAVQDTGIGIPSDQIHRVFGKFQQFSAAVQGEKGTGLGLSLCKSLVEMHRGKISVASEPGKGTTFSFTIPRRTTDEVFKDVLHRLYEEAASAGRCLSAFVFELEDLPGVAPFPGKLKLAAQLEAMVRNLFRSERDMALRDHGRLFFILGSVNKPQAKAISDQLIHDLIPVAEAAGAQNQVVVRAQFTCLPDDGTILEGLQAHLAG